MLLLKAFLTVITLLVALYVEQSILLEDPWTAVQFKVVPEGTVIYVGSYIVNIIFC